MSRTEKPLATLGDWTFYQIDGYEPGPFYGFVAVDDTREPRRFNEMYADLDHAMVAAVGEKHTGVRGAGGTGVATAADWFMKMIGAH